MFGLSIWMWLLLIIFGSYGIMYMQSLQNQSSKSEAINNANETLNPDLNATPNAPKEKYSSNDEVKDDEEKTVM